MKVSTAQRSYDRQLPEPEDIPRWSAEGDAETGWFAWEAETEVRVPCHCERRARAVAHELNAGGSPSELDAGLLAWDDTHPDGLSRKAMETVESLESPSPALTGQPDGKPLLERGVGHGNAVGLGVPLRSVTAEASDMAGAYGAQGFPRPDLLPGVPATLCTTQ